MVKVMMCFVFYQSPYSCSFTFCMSYLEEFILFKTLIKAYLYDLLNMVTLRG